MKPLIPCLGIAILVCLARPVVAENVARTPIPLKKQVAAPLQVTITKRDAYENVVSVQKAELTKAVSLASQLVPGALSGNHADVKSITITYN